MTYFVELSDKAEEHLNFHIKAGNKKLINRIYRLFIELSEHPETGTGKPHRLKHHKSVLWSRSIDSKHRMLYTVDNKKVIVVVISLLGHYDDK